MNIPPFALLHRAALLLRRTAGDLFVPPLTMSLPGTSGLSNKCHQTRYGVIAPKEAVAVCLDSSYLQNRACPSSVSAAPCGAFPAPAAAACTPSCDSPGAVVQPPAAPLAPVPQEKGTCVCSRGVGTIVLCCTHRVAPGLPFCQETRSPPHASGSSAAARLGSGPSRAKNCLEKTI